MVLLERELDIFANNRFIAGMACAAHLLHEARVAQESAAHFLKAAVGEPGPAYVALETGGVPESVVVLEVADRGIDPFFAAVALSHWLYALPAYQVTIH